jgi:hypothetical protein
MFPLAALNCVTLGQCLKCQVDGFNSANSRIIVGLEAIRDVLIEFSASICYAACQFIEHSSRLEMNQNRSGGIQESR